MNYKTYEVRVYETGTKEWCLNGSRHREDGPALEYSTGTKQWWLNGKHHREDGPAIEWANGDKEWWLNGESLPEAEFLTHKTTYSGKVVEIDGKKYKLTEV